MHNDDINRGTTPGVGNSTRQRSPFHCLKRLLCLIAPVLVAGCRTGDGRDLKIHAEVADQTGQQRLQLRFVEVPLPNRRGEEQAFDFHSLVWEAQDSDVWKSRKTITRSDFQGDTPSRRWVSELHSFDPDSGQATIKVGEEGEPDVDGVIHVTYSWRQWDLLSNREIRTIQVCESPFDKLASPHNGK